ncbi:prepilin-type N-terminal cleavage/methylation domain-containing protein [Candidatus Kaiserbacteria bacterium]|nr:prepilin-type N-terminal cleavage/methylation domain-containing protein [Candidatus Kaiserbacteria bacterium]
MTDFTKINQKNNLKGMTLVEAIVAIFIFSIVILVITNFTVRLYQTHGYTIAQAQQVDFASRGVNYIIRDIREMTYADDGAYPLVIADEHKIGFYSDIDRDRSVEYVEYELVGTGSTTLEKRIYNAAGSPVVYDYSNPDETLIISEYVQNTSFATSTFVYFDGEGNMAVPTTTISDIRYIQFSIIINIDLVRDPGQYMLRSSAALRNLKDNL